MATEKPDWWDRQVWTTYRLPLGEACECTLFVDCAAPLGRYTVSVRVFRKWRASDPATRGGRKRTRPTQTVSCEVEWTDWAVFPVFLAAARGECPLGVLADRLEESDPVVYSDILRWLRTPGWELTSDGDCEDWSDAEPADPPAAAG